MEGRKRGLFIHKVPLGFILFTFIDAKRPNFVPNFIKTFNKTVPSKMKDF